MKSKEKTFTITNNRLKMYLEDIKIINYWRANPAIACEDILGIAPTDAQSWMLAGTWVAKNAVWSCSRGFGKSFWIAVISILRALLYPNQNIYIVSSKGDQAKTTFMKIEELVKRVGKTADSVPDLKEYVQAEIETNSVNKDGFKHDPSSYSVGFYNGSKIFTLNSAPDNIRGKRASLVIFDEAAFCSDDLIIAVEPFTTQDSEFKVALDQNATSIKYAPTPPPNQRLYASSQDSMDAIFYTRYKYYAKRMLIGDLSAFVCDMPCDTAIEVYRFGQPLPPLLAQSEVDSMMESNPDKARREYYNKPDRNGGDDQIIKWRTIRDNEVQAVPYQCWKPENRIVLAFDPARTIDNSIMAAMNLYEDPDLGLCGLIVGCNNFVDIATKQKYKLDSNRQLNEIRKILLDYNGDNPDYEYIDSLLIDAGSGGGGVSTYADQLLNDWTDSEGKLHHGLIDGNNELYASYRRNYPNAIDKLRLVSPRKYRTQMVEEFIELMNLGVIKFPFEYSGNDFIRLVKGVQNLKDDNGKLVYDEDGNIQQEEIIENYKLSQDEKIHLTQIDLMKNEITSIYKSTNAEKTSVTYALAKEKANKIHDDRFYVCILLAHRLYELRRGRTVSTKKKTKNIDRLLQVRPPKIL